MTVDHASLLNSLSWLKLTAIRDQLDSLLDEAARRKLTFREALPEALRDGATGEALQAIVDLDLDELASIEPPRGFGRD
jgi:hypothetical protein